MADDRAMVIVWRVWERCSLGCAFCGYSRELPGKRLVADPQQIVRFARVLAEVQQQAGRALLISWLGGEPLDWPELPGLSRHLHRDLQLLLSVTTNGLPLEVPRVRESLLHDYAELTISLDGCAEFHDAVRKLPGLTARVRRGVQQLQSQASSLLLRVNTVLMRGNIEGFPEFCEEMAAWGFQELTFNQLGGNDRPEFYPENRLLPEQVERFLAQLPDLQQKMAEHGLAIRGAPRYLQRIVVTTRGERLAIEDCHPGSEFLFIDAAGRISPCSFSSAAYGIPLDEIDSPAEFLRLTQRFRDLRRRQRIGACDDCHATHVFEKFRSGALADQEESCEG